METDLIWASKEGSSKDMALMWNQKHARQQPGRGHFSNWGLVRGLSGGKGPPKGQIEDQYGWGGALLEMSQGDKDQITMGL